MRETKLLLTSFLISGRATADHPMEQPHSKQPRDTEKQTIVTFFSVCVFVCHNTTPSIRLFVCFPDDNGLAELVRKVVIKVVRKVVIKVVRKVVRHNHLLLRR